MQTYLNFVVLLLVGSLLSAAAQSSFYRHGRGKPISPPARYFMSSSGFVPFTYPNTDLYSSETKRISSAKKHSKKLHQPVFQSDEEEFSQEHPLLNDYSSESQAFNSKENDSHEYTIGTQIRVQHPITVPKKHTTSYSKPVSYHNQNQFKSSAYAEVNLSNEAFGAEPSPATSYKNKYQGSRYTQSYDADPIHVISAPKATAPSSTSYSSYDPEPTFAYKPTTSKKSKGETSQRYKNIASKKQIEAYLEDQQKLLNEALQQQLLNNPSLKQYLKNANNKESIEDDFEADPLPKLSPPQRGSGFSENFNYKPTRPARRRPSGDGKRSVKGSKHASGKPKRKYRSSVALVTA